jgi:hypothetical protein
MQGRCVGRRSGPFSDPQMTQIAQIAQIFKHQLPILSICENLCNLWMICISGLPRYFGCPPWATHLFRCSAALRLPPSLPLISPFGLPSSGYPASARWHVFAPAQLALRDNLRLVYLDLSQRSRFSRAFDSVKKLSELTCESQATRSLPDMLGLS